MTTYQIKAIDGSSCELWSDDTFTLHFGAGFDEQCESTPETLSAAVSESSLRRIVVTARNSNDREKAQQALNRL